MTSVDPRRSQILRTMKNQNNTPEMAVRRLDHSLGYRCCLHRSGLLGKPDLAFGPTRKLIFVHGFLGMDTPASARTASPKTIPNAGGPKFKLIENTANPISRICAPEDGKLLWRESVERNQENRSIDLKAFWNQKSPREDPCIPLVSSLAQINPAKHFP